MTYHVWSFWAMSIRQNDSEYLRLCSQVPFCWLSQSWLGCAAAWDVATRVAECNTTCPSFQAQCINNELYCRMYLFSPFHTAFANSLMRYERSRLDNFSCTIIRCVSACNARHAACNGQLSVVLFAWSSFCPTAVTVAGRPCVVFNWIAASIVHWNVYERKRFVLRRERVADEVTLMPWLKSAEQFNGSMAVCHILWHGCSACTHVHTAHSISIGSMVP